MTTGDGRFGALLKHWRSLRAISQLRLSESAGVSVKHIAFIETGRARPSRDMVLTLARSLGVPPREQNALLHAAGFAPAYPEAPIDSATLEPALNALKFVLTRHEPYPAFVVDPDWTLRLANKAARRLLARFSRVEPRFSEPPNALRLLFGDDWLRTRIDNWPEISAQLIERLKREADDPGLGAATRALLADLIAARGSPDQSDTHPTGPDTLPFVPLKLSEGRTKLSMFSLVSSFGTAVDLTLHELRIETLLPADEATARQLRRMARA